MAILVMAIFFLLMDKESCFELGHIVRKHSFKGEVVARFDTDAPENYADLEALFIEQKSQLIPYFIEKLSLLPKGVRLKLEEVDSEQHAEKLVGCKIFLHQSMLPEPDEGELFIHEIIGMDVVDSSHGNIGILDGVIEGKEQDILVVKHPSNKDIYIPWIKDIIVKEINTENRTILTECPEGLVDIYL
jgi:16S rRNA processing protein RimM